MRALLIDPYQQTVSEVDYDGDWKSIKRLLDIASRPFTIIQLGDAESHHMYLDDEGLYQPAQRFFAIAAYPQPLAGKGLILQDGEEGEEAPATVPLDVVANSISWLPKSFRFTGSTTREMTIDHPTFGRTTVIENIPHFIDTKRMN